MYFTYISGLHRRRAGSNSILTRLSLGKIQPGGAGAVVRNSEGRVLIAAYCSLSGCHNDEDAQARSALLGVKLLEGLGHEKVIQIPNCTTTVKEIRPFELDRSKCGNV
jgi:hypothetical protein